MCLLEWVEEGGRGTKAPLCPSLVSSPGNVRTSRGRQKQLDHDLSSGALRQIKVRHLMRRDQGDLSSCSKSCFNTSTRTWLDCPAIPTEEMFHPDLIILIKLGFHIIQREIKHHTRVVEKKWKTELKQSKGRDLAHSTMELLVSISKLLSCLQGNSDSKPPQNWASRNSSQWSRFRLISRNICCTPLSIIAHLRRDQHKLHIIDRAD